MDIMPEQQKIDETIESTSNMNKKKLAKIEQSSISLEKEQNPDAGTEIGTHDDRENILETQDEDLKE